MPIGQNGQMLYDAAGNLTTDTYSRIDPTRTYDGENRLVTNTDNSSQVSRYTYDSSGKRVRRNDNNQEKWQVNGIGGELIAEYAANAAPTNVQKEYGYRGGELLITASSTADIQWLLSDHLGTPRMIVDKTGTLSSVKRHDYLPFGEELFASIGGRTTNEGYGQADNVRQKFTKYERDNETGLDFAEARYFSSTQGRFTTVDPFAGSMRAGDPQSFNRYSYVGNNPVNRVDPSGLDWTTNAGVHAISSRAGESMFELDRVLGATNKGARGDFDDFYDPQQEEDKYPGGSPNPVAQLGPCPDLDVATFDQLGSKNNAALELLKRTYGATAAEAEYAKMSTYEKAVFLNTVAAAVSVGVDLSKATFDGFYRSTKPVGASEKGGCHLEFTSKVLVASLVIATKI